MEGLGTNNSLQNVRADINAQYQSLGSLTSLINISARLREDAASILAESLPAVTQRVASEASRFQSDVSFAPRLAAPMSDAIRDAALDMDAVPLAEAIRDIVIDLDDAALPKKTSLDKPEPYKRRNSADPRSKSPSPMRSSSRARSPVSQAEEADSPRSGVSVVSPALRPVAAPVAAKPASKPAPLAASKPPAVASKPPVASKPVVVVPRPPSSSSSSSSSPLRAPPVAPLAASRSPSRAVSENVDPRLFIRPSGDERKKPAQPKPRESPPNQIAGRPLDQQLSARDIASVVIPDGDDAPPAARRLSNPVVPPRSVAPRSPSPADASWAAGPVSPAPGRAAMPAGRGNVLGGRGRGVAPPANRGRGAAPPVGRGRGAAPPAARGGRGVAPPPPAAAARPRAEDKKQDDEGDEGGGGDEAEAGDAGDAGGALPPGAPGGPGGVAFVPPPSPAARPAPPPPAGRGAGPLAAPAPLPAAPPAVAGGPPGPPGGDVAVFDDLDRMLAAILGAHTFTKRRWSLWARIAMNLGVFDQSPVVANAIQRIKRDLYMNSLEPYVTRHTVRTPALAVRARAILWQGGSNATYATPSAYHYNAQLHVIKDMPNAQAVNEARFFMRAYTHTELLGWYQHNGVRAFIDFKQQEQEAFAEKTRRAVLFDANDRFTLVRATYGDGPRASELTRDIDPFACVAAGIPFSTGISEDEARTWALMTLLGDPRAAVFVWNAIATGNSRWCGVVQAIVYSAPINNPQLSDDLFHTLVQPPIRIVPWHENLWNRFAQAQRGDDVDWMYFDPIRVDWRAATPGQNTYAMADLTNDPHVKDADLYFQRGFSTAMPLLSAHASLGRPQGYRPTSFVVFRYVSQQLNPQRALQIAQAMDTYRNQLKQNWDPINDGDMRMFNIHADGVWYEINNNDNFVDDPTRTDFRLNDYHLYVQQPIVAVVHWIRWDQDEFRDPEDVWLKMHLDANARDANVLYTEEDTDNWHDAPNRDLFPRVTHCGVFRSYVFAQYEDTANGGAPIPVQLRHVERMRPLLVMPFF